MVGERGAWQRLYRFLLTTAHRSGIGQIEIAMVTARNRQVLFSKEENGYTLPREQKRNEESIHRTLLRLARDYGLRKVRPVRYLTRWDETNAREEKIRRFYFEVIGEQGARKKGIWIARERWKHRPIDNASEWALTKWLKE